MVLNVCQHRLCKFKTHGEVTLSNIKTFLSNACGNKKCHQSYEREKDLSKEKINFLMFIQKNYMKQRQLFIHANIFISDDWAVIVPNLAGAPYKTKRRQLSKPEKKSKLRNTHSKDVSCNQHYQISFHFHPNL